MFSSPSSPSVLASTSRHNIMQPQQQSQQQRQKSLRLFLGHQSDDEPASDGEFDFRCESDDEGGCAGGSAGIQSRSDTTRSLQPGRLSVQRRRSPERYAVSKRAYDDNEGHGVGIPSPSRMRTKRPHSGASPKKASIFAGPSTKQQAATSAAIPTTPTKRQKGLLVRGNVTPSRAFSIFKAAKQRGHQRQQHGLMTPPPSSPLRPIILDSFDDGDNDLDASPSRHRVRHCNAVISPPSARPADSSGTRSQTSPQRFVSSANGLKRSAFAGNSNGHVSHPQALHSLRTRQALLASNSRFLTAQHVSAARRPALDTTSFLETFVSPSTCVFQIPRRADQDVLSHPICAAYSYSSRAVNPSTQWLAVGDDEGRITLLNTLPWQDDSAQTFAANPQWQASSSSAIFEVAWRFDDRSLLTGASDFSIRSWDTEYQKCTAEFEGHGGSPRTMVYDPTTNGDGGCGMVFASAGRDGTIRIWDARTSTLGQAHCEEGDEGRATLKPVLTINAAHSTMAPIAPVVGSKGRKQIRTGPTLGGRGRKRIPQQPLPAGVTALSYLPDGQGHKLLSGGSANAIIKCWDLRHVRSQAGTSAAVAEVDPQSLAMAHTPSTWQTPDLSLLTPSSLTGLGTFKRSHGVSQILASSTSLYASCTGGKIYTLPLSAFLDSQLAPAEVQTLYDAVQCQNTLFSRMALFDDRFLAVGCNTGNIALWDVTTRRHSPAGKQQSSGERDTEEERRTARGLELGFGYRSRQEGLAVLTEGHAKNTEVNAVAWANGPNGPTLSSVGDDTNVRSWYADRVLRDSITLAANE